MKIWWPREERLKYELQALRDYGYAFEVIGGAPDGGGEMHVRVDYPIGQGQRTPLDVYFPELYPFFRFQIDAPELVVPHHQHPFLGNICVIGRSTENWSVKDTLANYLRERVPQVVRTGASHDPAEVRDVEERQAEPFSEYYTYEPDSIILISGDWQVPRDIAAGELVLGINEPPSPPLRAAVLRVVDDEGRQLAQADERLARLFDGERRARWLRLDEPIVEGDPERFFEVALQIDRRVGQQSWQDVRGGRIKLVAVLFPEEHEWRDAAGLGWVFAVRASLRIGDRAPRRKRQNKPQHATRHFFIRAGRAGLRDFQVRIPELRFLERHKIAVFGLGCLGATSVIEFAKAGIGELRLIDSDFVDPPTVVRWPLGLTVAGLRKARALQEFLTSNFPYTRLRGDAYHVGGVRRKFDGAELALLKEITDGISLIYDATAESGVQHFLSDLARELGVPYVCVWGTQGGFGGFVARIDPDRSHACWGCVEQARATGAISSPPEHANGVVQPQGCGDPTFTGTSFDMGTIALSAVRMAIASLSEQSTDYPRPDWNVEVISFRDEMARPIAPRWEVFNVSRNSTCRVCGSR